MPSTFRNTGNLPRCTIPRLSYAAGAVYADPSPAFLLACTAIAAGLVVVLLALFPPLRRMVDARRPHTEKIIGRRS
ncbi:hypothetical protein [Actinoplanes aureus]|uniref:Uncharacterized protein n=1 Tax=Actinoplanes aureus TaxID=2792083 RepID=A0A931BZM3_9ACTN|nr:hypothetical protein [Actinoplanes aureus]MBG0560514.1 hypothetical protein [Actinoplanes aureus]